MMMPKPMTSSSSVVKTSANPRRAFASSIIAVTIRESAPVRPARRATVIGRRRRFNNALLPPS
jgi:hypothetical protein